MVEVTLICTLYNEGESIRDLLDSLIAQTETPEEAVFVDGGSTDNTQKIIEEYTEDNPWIKLVVDEGCNIAEGRNTAIENASNDYIIGTDGGCILEKNWVKRMKEEFEKGNEALSGLWRPQSKNMFEFVQGEIRGHYIKSGNMSDNWAPSSRAIGFTRKAWEEAGKYPEHLYTGEDAKFNSNMRRAGYKWHVVKGAFVKWKMRPTWKAYWKQFRQYGEGDARAGNLFDYPGKIMGISKVFWRLSFTALALVSFPLALIHPGFLGLLILGLAPQYILKLPSLKSCIKQNGVKTIPYWLSMIAMESIAHFYGFFREKLELLKRLGR